MLNRIISRTAEERHLGDIYRVKGDEFSSDNMFKFTDPGYGRV